MESLLTTSISGLLSLASDSAGFAPVPPSAVPMADLDGSFLIFPLSGEFVSVLEATLFDKSTLAELSCSMSVLQQGPI